MNQTLLFLLMSCVGSLSFAYVPTTQFIFDRLTSQHGKGQYSIDMEVVFHEGMDTVVFRENWLVNDGGEMRLRATGDGSKIFRILKRNRVLWIDESGSEHADEISPDFFMSPLLTRNSTEEKRFFIKWKIVPPEALREKRLPRDVKDIHFEPENFVRLGRVSGTVAYAFGQPSPPDGTPFPGLWIEQDAFVVRKMRAPDSSEFAGNDYVTYARNLMFPKTQMITFDNHLVSIRTTRVAGIEFSNEQRRQFDATWLRGHPDAVTQFSKSSLAAEIQEFYKRFR